MNWEKKIREITDKYFPTNGCENCWGDLHQGCTEKCQEEFKIRRNFIKDLSFFKEKFDEQENKWFEKYEIVQQDLKSTILEKLPEEKKDMDMGYTEMGYNQCLREVISLINSL